MITEDYISFEIAKLLKEKGFDETNCNTCYKYNGKFCNNRKSMSGVDSMICYPAPTHQMAMKWLLNVHNIYVTILQTEHTTVTMEQRYFFYRIQKNRKNAGIFTDTFMKPEEACEAAIKYCLENLI